MFGPPSRPPTALRIFQLPLLRHPGRGNPCKLPKGLNQRIPLKMSDLFLEPSDSIYLCSRYLNKAAFKHQKGNCWLPSGKWDPLGNNCASTCTKTCTLSHINIQCMIRPLAGKLSGKSPCEWEWLPPYHSPFQVWTPPVLFLFKTIQGAPLGVYP